MNEKLKKLVELKYRHKLAQEKVENAINDEELTNASTEVRSLVDEISTLETEISKINNENEKFRKDNLGGGKMPNVIYKRDNETDLEFRNKFMKAVQEFNLEGLEKRTNQYTSTTDVAIVIPQNLVDDIILDVTNRGYILSRCNKTNFAIGQKIPVGMTAITATWVGVAVTNPTGEGLGSDVQKSGITTYVQFTNHKLRCVVGMTYEAGLQSLAIFEQKFVQCVSDAIVAALETSVVNGDGINQPKGILTETPISGQALELAAGSGLTYKNVLKFISKVPAKYRNGAVAFMTQATFFEILAITDSNGQPIARVNFGLNGEQSQSLFGMPVVFADEYMSDYADSVASDTKFAFIYNFKEYTLNTNYDLGLAERTVWENEDKEIKAVMAADGKPVTKRSFVTWTKKA